MSTYDEYETRICLSRLFKQAVSTYIHTSITKVQPASANRGPSNGAVGDDILVNSAGYGLDSDDVLYKWVPEKSAPRFAEFCEHAGDVKLAEVTTLGCLRS